LTPPVEAVVPAALLLVAIHRIRVSRRRGTTAGRAVTRILLLMAFAQGMRVHALTDDHLDPIVHRVSGIWNTSCVVAQCTGVFVCAEIVAVVVMARGRQITGIARYGVPAALVGVMVVAFLNSPASSTRTRFLSQTFPATGPMLVYWVIFIGSIGSTAAIVLYWMWRMREVLVLGGRFAHALIAVMLASAAGLVWSIHKITYLVLRGHDIENWYTSHTTIISLVLISSPLAMAGCVAIAHQVSGLPERLARYRAIRNLMSTWQSVRESSDNVVLDSRLIPATRFTTWKASINSMASHRMMVEIADATRRVDTGTEVKSHG
jgi:hypothetical protein